MLTGLDDLSRAKRTVVVGILLGKCPRGEGRGWDHDWAQLRHSLQLKHKERREEEKGNNKGAMPKVPDDEEEEEGKKSR